MRKGELDPFAVAAMEEIGIDIAKHRPMTFEELEDLEGLNFDLIVTLSPEAHHKALELTRTLAAEVEYWPTADPTVDRRQPRAAARRLSRGPRPAHGADQGALRRRPPPATSSVAAGASSCRTAAIPLGSAPIRAAPGCRSHNAGCEWRKKNFWNFPVS